jgi:methionine-rich copper-binding protein CopC
VSLRPGAVDRCPRFQICKTSSFEEDHEPIYKVLPPHFVLACAHARSSSVGLAHAHPTVRKPAPDSTGPAPSSISITFSEAVEPKFSSIQLTDEKGKSVDSDASRPKPNDPKTLILAVPKLTAGTYIVHWANVAVDGHRLEGSYKFTVR